MAQSSDKVLKIQCQVCGSVIAGQALPCEACGNINGWVPEEKNQYEMIDWESMPPLPPEEIYIQDEEEMIEDDHEQLYFSDQNSAAVLLLKWGWRLILLIVSYFVLDFYAREAASGFVYGLFALHNFSRGDGARWSGSQQLSIASLFIWVLPVVVIYWCSSQRDAIVSFLDEKLPHTFKFVVSDVKFATKFISDGISYMRLRAFCMFLAGAIIIVLTAMGVTSSIVWFAALIIPSVVYMVATTAKDY